MHNNFCNRAGSGELRVLSYAYMFFINNDIIRFVFILRTCEGGDLKGTFPIHILSSTFSKEMKLSEG